MKKIIIILILIVSGYILVKEYPTESKNKEEEVRSVFISYIELEKYIKNRSEKESKKNIDQMIQNIKDFKLNTIILQVRAASDAIYDSKIFPYSTYISTNEGEKTFDVLEYFLNKTHEKNMKLIAWINPYRIRTNEDINTITENSPAYKYLNTDTIYIKNGIYWNPSKEEVTNLIIDGVKEILSYKVDGILFDDYFYPDNEIDMNDYEKYCEEHESITKQEYNLQVINQMIKKVYQECHKKNIKFGVSPDGNIENNYEKHYADVKRWMMEEGYIDFIMPQIYYGFYNSTKGYSKVIKEWEELIKIKDLEFYTALAFYKIGKPDAYAKEGKEEWIENNNIIMREIILSRNRKNYKGFALFRYDNIFDSANYSSNSITEINNIKKIIK